VPLGGATVSNDLVFTMLYDGALVALNRDTGLVYGYALPTSANSTIAIAEHRPRARRGTQNGLGRRPTTVGRLRHPLRLQDQVMRLHIAHWGFTTDVRKSRNVLGSARERPIQARVWLRGGCCCSRLQVQQRLGLDELDEIAHGKVRVVHVQTPAGIRVCGQSWTMPT
jgi:hypothetical protein